MFKLTNLKNDDKEIIKYFEEKGFNHQIKKDPMINYNQLTKNDEEGIIFFYMGGNLIIQNQEGTSFSLKSEKLKINYNENQKSIMFKINKNCSIVIKTKTGENKNDD